MAPQTRSKARQEAKRCCFLELPAELRNRIYDYALPQGQDLMIQARRLKPVQMYLRSRQNQSSNDIERYLKDLKDSYEILLDEPALLRVNRQVRNEATAMYYKRTTFIASGQHVLHGWLHHLGPERRDLVHSCVLDVDCWHDSIGLAWTAIVFRNLSDHIDALGLRLAGGALKLQLPDAAAAKVGAPTKRLGFVQTCGLLELTTQKDREKYSLLFGVSHEFAKMSEEELLLVSTGFGAVS